MLFILSNINRLPTTVLNNKSPFKVLFNTSPNYANFKSFGYWVFPYLRDYASNKLAPRSVPCIFLGYSSSHKGLRCCDPIASRFYTTRHAQFDEFSYPFADDKISINSDGLDISSFLEPTAGSILQPASLPSGPSFASPPCPTHALPGSCSLCPDHPLD